MGRFRDQGVEMGWFRDQWVEMGWFRDRGWRWVGLGYQGVIAHLRTFVSQYIKHSTAPQYKVK